MNLSFDILGFMQIFKGSTFRSIDQIILSGPCKLRRIFTMKSSIYDVLIPKHLGLPPGFPVANQLI